ncbi:T-complex protein 11-domain-containing protein [Gongronella butleri]|nr:T-complex protein 11-domain-containing protein [Gongronella butleri]
MSLPTAELHDILTAVDQVAASRTPVNAVERLVVDETWNSFYTVRECLQQPPTDPTLTQKNLTALYLQLCRLHHLFQQQQQEDDALVQRLGAIIEQGVGPCLSDASATSHSIAAARSMSPSPPASPTLAAAFQEGEHVISQEQLQRVLAGFAPSELSNEQLAHDLVLDPEYTVKPAQKHPLQARVEAIAKQAFYDQIDAAYEDENYDQLLPLLTDLKDRLLALAPDRTRAQLDDKFDLQLARQQMQNPPFLWRDWALAFVDTMATMVAPVRDRAIQQLRTHINSSSTTSTPGQIFAEIMAMLEKMSMDLANFRLQSLRPHLLPIAVDYERGKFSKAIQESNVGLANTRQWLQKSLHGANFTNDADLRQKMSYAYTQLVSASSAWTRLTCPETCLLDLDRVVQFQNKVQTMVVTACLMLLAQQFNANQQQQQQQQPQQQQQRQQQQQQLAHRFLDLLDETDPPTRLAHLSAELEKHVPEAQRSMCQRMVSKTLQESDPVFQVLFKRVTASIRAFLATGKLVHDASLAPIRDPLTRLVKRIALFAHYNEKVYETWYRDLIASIDRPLAV